MSAPAGIVLGATIVVSSPILWLVHEGSLSVEDAVLRWFICLALCRVAISVVSSLAFPAPAPATRSEDAAPTTATTTGPATGPAAQPAHSSAAL